MKYIVIFLSILTIFSSYMAITSSMDSTSSDSVVQDEPLRGYYIYELETPYGHIEEPEYYPYGEYYEEEDDDYYSEEEYQEFNDQVPTVTNNFIEQEIINVFGSESRLAIAVAWAESELNPYAITVNGDGTKDIGIFQLNDAYGWSVSERLNWKTNITLAKDLRDRHGWNQWVAYKNEAYKSYL